MSHFGDSMDGVPVKISEKYKRPPRIELPYSVTESPLRAQSFVDSVKYCSTFERNVLSKLKELKSAKETKRNERRHRLQLLEEAKQKKLDAIAVAEAEEKLKQLSVSDVSYPSTDEISALSPDEKAEKNCDIGPTRETSPEIEKAVTTESNCMYNSSQEPLNILQPIQIQSSFQQNNLLDDPDPLQEFKMNMGVAKIPQRNRNIDTLTFKDFENDTSSPFDNVELKTINDMELLAQVLQNQRESSTSVQPQIYNDQAYNNCATQAHLGGTTYLPPAYIEQPIQDANIMYPTLHYPAANSYYMPQENVCDNTVPMENVYAPNYQYYAPAQPYPVAGNYYSNQIPSSSGEIQIPQQYYYQYPQPMVSYVPNTYNAIPEVSAHDTPSVSVQNTVKSRSRSVPDIVKELNQELEFAKREKQRANERSCNASPALVKVPLSSSSSDKKENRRKRRIESLPNPYEKLPPNSQSMCQKIHGMGFPLDRVARVCNLVGDSDKKVIECLLILGEMMDLGFTEARASAALTKHQFNREKALDELVS